MRVSKPPIARQRLAAHGEVAAVEQRPCAGKPIDHQLRERRASVKSHARISARPHQSQS